jgi:hypothetical protein
MDHSVLIVEEEFPHSYQLKPYDYLLASRLETSPKKF